MNFKKDKIKLLDCTMRDGGYVNNWDFDKKLVREAYRALSKAGVDYVELGYHGTEEYFDKNKYGAFRFCKAEDINDICRGIDGAMVALMVDHGKFRVSDLAQYEDTPVKLIRIAFHKDKLEESLALVSQIKDQGFKCSINLMGFGSYTEQDRDKLLALLKEMPLDYAYVADTYGSMFPNQIPDFYKPLLDIKHVEWGFHAHNNLQMGFANSLAAINAGASIVDGSIFGMGRGAGNLPTEIMLGYLSRVMPERYNVIPVLNLIDRYFGEIHRKYGWGYNLPHMLSGTYGCHPNYAKNLVERKEYDIEDIWNILGIIKGNEPIGYKKELVDEILKKGFFGKRATASSSLKSGSASDQDKVNVPYTDRHQGRDFLVLANGPSLKMKQEELRSFIKKYDPVVIGANYLKGLFAPDYHAFTSRRRFADYVEHMSKDSKLLIGQHIPLDMVKDYVDTDYETIYYEDTADAPFAISNNIVSSNCRSVSVLLIAIAIIMGARRIFVAGLDGYMEAAKGENVHFYSEKDETDNREVLLDRHFGNLRYLEEIDEYLCKQGKEGIHIITPTNYTKFYKGISNYI